MTLGFNPYNISGKTRLTPTDDQTGEIIKLKVFWPTTNVWNPNRISDYHQKSPLIMQKLISEQYWNRQGSVEIHRFTCEDFAIRVLCEFAQPRGLPVKLTTGVRTYRNMEIYTPELHDKYESTVYGFTEMVMLTFGAPDMQKPQNTLPIENNNELLPGDILAQEHDRPGSIAHHIQMVYNKTSSQIDIRQGNTKGLFYRPISTIRRWLGSNLADPQNEAYAGMPIETGRFTKTENGWDYRNLTTGNSAEDFLRIFTPYRWNFMEFNR